MNKIYLKISPTCMVTNLKENLHGIINRSYNKFCEKNKEASQEEFKQKFVGKIVKTKYAAWHQYYKITDICFDHKLSEKTLTINGKNYSLLKTFKAKFPFQIIDDLDQFIVKAVP